MKNSTIIEWMFNNWENPYGIVATMLDYSIVVSEFNSNLVITLIFQLLPLVKLWIPLSLQL